MRKIVLQLDILVKLTFHWLAPPRNSKFVATKASYAREIPNKARKAILRAVSPHHKLMPKADIGSVLHNKSSIAWERIPTFSDVLPHPHPKGSCWLRGTPPAPRTVVFGVVHYSPPRVSLNPIALQPFT
jgi:hypothetical protein